MAGELRGGGRARRGGPPRREGVVQALAWIRVRARAARAHRERGGAETQRVSEAGALRGVQAATAHVVVEAKEHRQRAALETPDRARRLRWRAASSSADGETPASCLARASTRSESARAAPEGHPALRVGPPPARQT